MNIPEEAVEAAARAIDPMAWDTHYRFTKWEEQTGNAMPVDAMGHLVSGPLSLARAAIAAAAPALMAQALRDAADWGDETQEHYYWGYEEVSETLRARANEIETKGQS
jgi:hypothetical protein